MSFTHWGEALAHLSEVIAAPTDEQRALAVTTGLRLSNETPGIVAAALLRHQFRKPLALSTESPPTEAQQEFLEALTDEFEKQVPDCDSADQASAWIQYFLTKKRAEALQRLRLKQGDLVTIAGSEKEIVEQVASIGRNGCVYFKGGRARAWPDRLILLASSEDTSQEAATLRKEALNRAAGRATLGQWSVVRQKELLPFRASEKVTHIEIQELESIMEESRDEKPIQAFLGSHRHVLASLVRGPERFCIPQQSLSGKFISDFLLADVDSMGIRWILVELESPQSKIKLEKSNEFDKYARKGISQVREWREWIQNNLDQARRRIREDGLGLFEIRPQSDGLIIVGRRNAIQPGNEALRNQLWEDERIKMHSYDWLVEQLYGGLTFSGLSAVNPYLLSRPDEDDDEL